VQLKQTTLVNSKWCKWRKKLLGGRFQAEGGNCVKIVGYEHDMQVKNKRLKIPYLSFIDSSNFTDTEVEQ
jgi:hypothetical protein